MRPPVPVDVRATWDRASMHISWRHPAEATSRRPIRHYVIQYRTVGHWVPLVTLPVNSTSYDWMTASRGATYQFRLFSVSDKQLRSEPSPTVTVHTTGYRVTHTHMASFTSPCLTSSYLWADGFLDYIQCSSGIHFQIPEHLACCGSIRNTALIKLPVKRG